MELSFTDGVLTGAFGVLVLQVITALLDGWERKLNN